MELRSISIPACAQVGMKLKAIEIDTGEVGVSAGDTVEIEIDVQHGIYNSPLDFNPPPRPVSDVVICGSSDISLQNATFDSWVVDVASCGGGNVSADGDCLYISDLQLASCTASFLVTVDSNSSIEASVQLNNTCNGQTDLIIPGNTICIGSLETLPTYYFPEFISVALTDLFDQMGMGNELPNYINLYDSLSNSSEPTQSSAMSSTNGTVNLDQASWNMNNLTNDIIDTFFSSSIALQTPLLIQVNGVYIPVRVFLSLDYWLSVYGTTPESAKKSTLDSIFTTQEAGITNNTNTAFENLLPMALSSANANATNATLRDLPDWFVEELDTRMTGKSPPLAKYWNPELPNFCDLLVQGPDGSYNTKIEPNLLAVFYILSQVTTFVSTGFTKHVCAPVNNGSNSQYPCFLTDTIEIFMTGIYDTVTFCRDKTDSPEVVGSWARIGAIHDELTLLKQRHCCRLL